MPKFNFPCVALCSIKISEFKGSVEVEGVTILGFWPTHEAAEANAMMREQWGKDKHHTLYKVVDGRWPAYPLRDPGYTPTRYEIVPLSEVIFDNLAKLQDDIEGAALMRFTGLGKEAVQP